jgi:low affinity Fe/Cu permease
MSSNRRAEQRHDADGQAQVKFLRQTTGNQHTSGRPPKMTNALSTSPMSLSQLKQQRLIAAADRKKRLITRIVTIVGIVIMLLCAAIVALTLKMAPKIDELVRSKNGPNQYVQLISRLTSTMGSIIDGNRTRVEQTQMSL